MAWYWEAPPHAQKGMSSIRETGSSLCQRLIGALQRQLCGMFQGVSTKAVGLRALHMQKFYNLGPPLAFPLICLPESSKARMCSSTSDTSQMQHCIVGSQPCYQPSACFPPPPDVRRQNGQNPSLKNGPFVIQNTPNKQKARNTPAILIAVIRGYRGFVIVIFLFLLICIFKTIFCNKHVLFLYQDKN